MNTIFHNPVELVESLVADEIRQRLIELDHQERALRVLLKAAVAREKHHTRSASVVPQQSEATRD
jgi:hypothetical protein